MSVLLDGNVLVALVSDDHVHHGAAEAWFAGSTQAFATCPITQGTLLRLLMRAGATAGEAWAILAGVTGAPRHVFWPDELDYHEVSRGGVLGHRQVTDAYLADLARRRGGRLATFDRGLAGLHRDVVVCLPAPAE